MSQYRQRQRAHETETAAARWYAEHGWPFAEPVGAGRNGADLTGLPGLAAEIKARRDFSMTTWLNQATGHRGGLPFVLLRPDGYGPARIAEWPVIMRLAEHTELLRGAGYGG